MEVGDSLRVGPESGVVDLSISSDAASSGSTSTATIHVQSGSGDPVTLIPAVQSLGNWLKLKNNGPVTTPADLPLLIDGSGLMPGQSYTGTITANWAGTPRDRVM